MANPVGQGNIPTSSSSSEADSAVANMEAAFDRAISKASEVSAKRQEAGATLDAARTRLSN